MSYNIKTKPVVNTYTWKIQIIFQVSKTNLSKTKQKKFLF